MKRYLSLVVVLAALLVGAAHAQETAGTGLSVSLVFPPDTPAKSYFSYKVAPGATQEGALDLQNNSKKPLQVDLYPADAYNTPDGALTGPLMGQPSQTTGTWLTVDTTHVVLNPGQGKRVKFKMAVPANVAAGDYFAFIFVQPGEVDPTDPKKGPDPNGKSPVSINVKVVQRLGICIWERVPGALQFGLKAGAVKKLIDRGRLFLELELTNTGNTYLKPMGTWTLTSPSGETVTTQADNELGYILPGHPMKLRIPVQTTRPLARGEYTLEYSLTYGDQKLADKLPVTLP